MRIGTWNLAGRWDTRHAHLMRQQNCEVWLLTEVSESLALEEYTKHMSASSMPPRRRWAAILTRTALLPLPDPHAASALARVGDLHFCSSILPWRSCGSRLPWIGSDTPRTRSQLWTSCSPIYPKGAWSGAVIGITRSVAKNFPAVVGGEAVWSKRSRTLACRYQRPLCHIGCHSCFPSTTLPCQLQPGSSQPGESTEERKASPCRTTTRMSWKFTSIKKGLAAEAGAGKSSSDALTAVPS